MLLVVKVTNLQASHNEFGKKYFEALVVKVTNLQASHNLFKIISIRGIVVKVTNLQASHNPKAYDASGEFSCQSYEFASISQQ